MKHPVFGTLWALVAVALFVFFARRLWFAPYDVAWQLNMLGFGATAFSGFFGFMLITGWGFKKGFREDVQCVGCYRYGLLPAGPNCLVCHYCGTQQADRPPVVEYPIVSGADAISMH